MMDAPSRREIAALLGVVPGTIQQAVARSFRKLRIVARTAQHMPQSTNRQATKEAESKQAQCKARRAEQEARVADAYARLEAQGVVITMLALAQAAQVGTTIANAYLCKRWGTVQQRLEQAYARLVTEDGPITVERLAKAARVSERASSNFLHVQRGTVRQVHPRRKSLLPSSGKWDV